MQAEETGEAEQRDGAGFGDCGIEIEEYRIVAADCSESGEITQVADGGSEAADGDAGAFSEAAEGIDDGAVEEVICKEDDIGIEG